MKNRACRECGNALYGRKDQKYCSDYCRNTFNNRLNEDANAYVRKVNRIIKKNRRILVDSYQEGNMQTTLYHLMKEGFNPDFYTNYKKNVQGKKQWFCYDYGFEKIEKEKILLIKSEEVIRQ